MAGSALAALFMFAQLILFACEPSSVFATRALILAGVLSGLLILGRSAILFTGFQMALALGVILLTKFTLQHFNWYGFQPNAWLHPWALQTQGIVLGLMCLAWIVTRALAGRRAAAQPDQSEGHWMRRIVPDQPIAFDQVLSVTLSIGFVMLLILGSASGISRELTNAARTPRQFDLAGYPHQLIFGVGSLILLVILLAVMFRNFRERRHEAFAVGTMVMFWSVCPLVAGRFELQFATASAGRWSVAIFLLLVSIAYAFREKFTRTAWREQDGLTEQNGTGKQFVTSRVLLLFITLVPLILLTLSPVVDAINYVPARGPQSGIFRAMGATVLYGLPLMLSAAALAIHAVRERSPAFLFAAGLLTNFTVTVVHIVSVAAVNGPMNRTVIVNSLQLNAIAAASIALLWMATRRWWLTDDRPLPLGPGRGKDLAREPKTIDYSSYLGPENIENEGAAFSRRFASNADPVPGGEGAPLSTEGVLLICQKFFAIVLNTLWIVPLTLHLVAFPDRVSRATFAGGSFNGWLAVLITITAVVTLDRLFQKALRVVGLAASLLAIASLTSFGIARFDVARWSGLHVLLGALVVIAWLLLTARNLPRKQPFSILLSRTGLTFDDDWVWDSELFATLVGAMAVLIALRGAFSDPRGAWSSIGALLAMSALAASLNWVTFRRGYLYAAGVLFNFAVSIWLLKYQSGRVTSLSAFVEGNVIALSLTGVLWLYLELRTRRAQPNSKSNSAAAFHNVAVLASLLAIGIIVGVRLHDDLFGFYPIFAPLLDLLSLASLAALMVACLWDSEAEYAVAGLYLIGLLSSATVLHHQQMTPRHLIWSLMMAASTQAFLAALLWRARQPVIAGATRLKIPTRTDPARDELGWLLSFNCAVVSIIVAIVFWIALSFIEWPLRAVASFAVITQAATFGLMAQGKRRAMLQRTAVAIFLAGLVFLGWSCLTPGTTGTWLNRAVVLNVAAIAHPDEMTVAADDGVVPDRDVVAEHDVADHRGRLRQEDALAHPGIDVVVRPHDHGCRTITNGKMPRFRLLH